MSVRREGPKLTIYSQRYQASSLESSKVRFEKKRLGAKEITQNGRVISSGKETERLGMDIFGDTETYNFAIQTLTAAQQAQVATKGLSWFQSLRWAPLKVGDTTVLLNIRGATKRLRDLGVEEGKIKALFSKPVNTESHIELFSEELFEIIKKEKIKKLKNELNEDVLNEGGNKNITQFLEKIVEWMDKGVAFQELKHVYALAKKEKLITEELDPKTVKESLDQAQFFYRYQQSFKEAVTDFSKGNIDHLKERMGINEKDVRYLIDYSIRNKLDMNLILNFYKEKRIDFQQLKNVLIYKEVYGFETLESAYQEANELKAYYDFSDIQLQNILSYKHLFNLEIYKTFKTNTLEESKKQFENAKKIIGLDSSLVNKIVEIGAVHRYLEMLKEQNGIQDQELQEHIELADLCKSPIEEVVKFKNSHQLTFAEVKNIISYKLVFGSATLEVALKAINQLKSRNMDEESIKKIVFLIKEHPEWLIPNKDGKPMYIRARDFPGELPRNLQINADGTIYILFNKVSGHNDKLIGRGSSKKVIEAVELTTGKMAARITQVIDTIPVAAMARNELALSIELSGRPGIARIYEVSTIEYTTAKTGQSPVKKIGYLSELYDGDLRTLQFSQGEEESSPDKLLPITNQLLSPLAYLHEQQVIHRDINSANIFFKRNSVGELEVVLGDFSVSCKQNDTSERQTLAGMANYHAPELWLAENKEAIREASTPKIDCWSMGLVLFEMYRARIPEWKHIKHPAEGMPDKSTMTREEELEYWNNVSDDWLPKPADKDSAPYVIWQMLRKDPAVRIDSSKALAEVAAIRQKEKRISDYASEHQLTFKSAFEILSYPDSKEILELEKQQAQELFGQRAQLRAAKLAIRYMAYEGVDRERARDIYQFFTAHPFVSFAELKRAIAYQADFKTESLSIAWQAIRQLQERNILELDIRKIAAAIQGHPEWLVPRRDRKPVYIRAKDFPADELPRNLQINADGSIYILFNRVKQGDTLLGEGTFKRAKEAMELASAQMAARLTMVVSNEKKLNQALSEYNLSTELSTIPGLAHTFQDTLYDYPLVPQQGCFQKFFYKFIPWIQGIMGQQIGKLAYMQERYEKDNLFNALQKGRLTTQETQLIILQLLEGMAELHKRGYIHRDLKPQNIYLIRDPITKKVTNVVIGDFGLTCKMDDTKERAVLCGTPFYSSPEIHEAIDNYTKKNVLNAATEKADCWSMGIILYMLNPSSVVKGGSFFRILGGGEQEKLLNGQLEEPQDHTSIGHVAWELLKVNPEERITAQEALTKARQAYGIQD